MTKRSDGYYHERNARVTLILLCGVALLLMCLAFGVKELGLLWFGNGLMLGGVCGWLITPDLDHLATTRDEYRARRLFGKWLGAAFHAYWSFYPPLVGGHGSRWSHGEMSPLGWIMMIGIATPIRILYTFWVLILAVVLSHALRSWIVMVPIPVWLGIYVGWATQDLVHWIRDYFI